MQLKSEKKSELLKLLAEKLNIPYDEKILYQTNKNSIAGSIFKESNIDTFWTKMYN